MDVFNKNDRVDLFLAIYVCVSDKNFMVNDYYLCKYVFDIFDFSHSQ